MVHCSNVAVQQLILLDITIEPSSRRRTMQNEIFETMTKFNQQTLENWKKLGEANLKLSEKLLKEQVELTSALVEATTAKAEELAKTKDVKAFAELQAEWAQDISKKLNDTSRSYADILAEAGKTYNTLFETTLKAAGNDFVKQAKTASKAA